MRKSICGFERDCLLRPCFSTTHNLCPPFLGTHLCDGKTSHFNVSQLLLMQLIEERSFKLVIKDYILYSGDILFCGD